MAAHQLVVSHAALQVLGDHVDVLEVALDQVALVGGGRPRGVVDGVDDLRGQPDTVRRGEAQDGAFLERDRAGRGLAPDIPHRLHQERAAGAQRGLGLADIDLNHRLVAEQRLHGTGRFRAGQLEEGVETTARHPERDRGVA